MKMIILTFLLILSVSFFTGCVDEDPPIDEKEDVIYTVKFLDIDGNEFTEISVFEGDTVYAPDAPEVPGYKFIKWDGYFTSVRSDLTITPIYKKVYNVTFLDDQNETLKVEVVEEGCDATPPDFKKEGYEFIGWDKDYTNVHEDLVIQPLLIEIMKNDSSYVENMEFKIMTDYSQLISKISHVDNLKYTFNNVKHGGARGTNEIVYYDETLAFNTNIYGFEVAIDKFGIVVERATKVAIPSGGFVLSAHGTSATLLQNNVATGDIVIYANNQALVYRKTEISNIISLGIEVKRLIEEVKTSNNNYVPLDYEVIHPTLNDLIDVYNALVIEYNLSEYKLGKQLALDLDFMLIEPTSVGVRAMWHYPLRATGYPENNEEEVRRFLDKVKENGLNRIYLNTNFNGKAIYKSDYLATSLTGSNNYGTYSDYLECFIEEAHQRSIQVFAWTNTLIAGDGVNNPFYSSKGWILKGINGEDNHNGMYFLDISNDEVQEFLKNVFKELSSKYKLDGIEFDFIRYPSGNLSSNPTNIKDWGYTDSFISKFLGSDTYNIDSFKELIKNDSNTRSEWLDFKMNLLTDTVEMLSTTIREARPTPIWISAAVMPNINGAKSAYLQDWETWIKSDYVDILEPMIYTADNKYLVDTINNMKKVVGNYADIVAGIFPEGNGGSSSMNAKQIALIEKLGISGWSKFSGRTIFSSDLKSSMYYMSRDYLVVPLKGNFPDSEFNAYLNDLEDKITNYYRYRVEDLAFADFLNMIDGLQIVVDPDIKFAVSELGEIISKIENEVIRENLENEHLKISEYINSIQSQ